MGLKKIKIKTGEEWEIYRASLQGRKWMWSGKHEVSGEVIFRARLIYNLQAIRREPGLGRVSDESLVLLLSAPFTRHLLQEVFHRCIYSVRRLPTHTAPVRGECRVARNVIEVKNFGEGLSFVQENE